MLDFLGIGAQKSATTWLYKNLTSHPEICFPAGKEVHFWDHEHKRNQGVEQWLQLFANPIDGVKQGEITPAYACLEQDLIKEIYHHFPNLPIFYSLRNPIERAWAGARHNLKHESSFPEDLEQWLIQHFHSTGSRLRTDYETCFLNWSAVFPCDQIQIIFYDDICCNPRRVLKQLACHLDIDPEFFNQVADADIQQRVHMGLEVEFTPKLQSILHEMYDAKIDRLSQLFDRNLSHWKRTSLPPARSYSGSC